MRQIEIITRVGLAAVLLIALAGCTNTGQHGMRPMSASPLAAPSLASSPAANGSAAMLNDPCDERMQNIAGLLLMYLNRHPNLPASLDELRGEPGFEDVKEFVCPASHQPYTYNPQGLFYEGGILVLYDSTPIHNGQRWAIGIAKPSGKQPLMAKVIAVKEADFAKAK